jgi:hypothetical protein
MSDDEENIGDCMGKPLPKSLSHAATQLCFDVCGGRDTVLKVKQQGLGLAGSAGQKAARI